MAAQVPSQRILKQYYQTAKVIPDMYEVVQSGYHPTPFAGYLGFFIMVDNTQS